MNPKISILTPSFNHEKYVGLFIESVLQQSFDDFELIIVDDFSSDNNVKEILRFQDTRIKLIQHEYNQGINAGLNTAFLHSCGEYLVFCASDDMFVPNALEIIYNAWQENQDKKALYTHLTTIDANGTTMGSIDIKKRTRAEHLHYMFMRENPLTSPGMSLKRKDFEEILYPLDTAMCNHQDTQMHALILLHGDIEVLPQHLVLYRSGQQHTQSISAKGNVTIRREIMEIPKFLDSFLSIKDTKLLEEVFAKEIQELAIKPQSEAMEYFLGYMALHSHDETRKIWGYHTIMQSYNTKEKAQILKKLYNFDFKEYLQLTQYISNAEIEGYYTKQLDATKEKYHKYKKLFNILLPFSIIMLCTLICMVFWRG